MLQRFREPPWRPVGRFDAELLGVLGVQPLPAELHRLAGRRCGRCGVPLRRRSRTSKQMCHPAAPIEMKRRSMLCHSVRRVPPPNGFEFPPDIVATPVVLEHPGSVGSRHRGFGNLRRGRSHRGELHRGSSRTQAPIGVERRPLAQLRRVGQRLPDLFRRVAQFSDENERPLLSVLSYLRPAGRTRCVLLAIGHLLLLVFLFRCGVDGSMRSRWRSRAST